MSSNGHPSLLSPEALFQGDVPRKDSKAAEIVPSPQWHDVVRGYVEEAHETKADLSALLIDIDALKAANDELGHEAGDQLIDMVGRVNDSVLQSLRVRHDPKHPNRKLDPVMANTVELKDLDQAVSGVKNPNPRAARIGGDEFGIILPRTDWEIASMIADRVRSNVTAELAKPENQPLADIGAGVSIGISTLQPGMDASDFLRIADQGMYANKLKQLRQLSPEQEADFTKAVMHLKEAGVRPRDVPKYLQLLGASAVTHAIEHRINPGQLVIAGTTNQES